MPPNSAGPVAPGAPSGAGVRPMMFLVIDAIPFEVAHELWSEGTLPGFLEPQPLISVFPSLTHVAVPALIRCAFSRRNPGYEARYFHLPTRSIRGGFSDPSAEAAMEPYRVRPKGNLGHLAVYTLSRSIAYGAVRFVTRRFRQEGGPWLGYIAATDGIGHFMGRDALKRATADIFEQVVQARDDYEREHGERPGIALASDHGTWFGLCEEVDVRQVARALHHHGFETGTHDGAVTLLPMGATGGGVAYCAPEDAPRVARVVAGVRGVDVAFGRDGDGFYVFGGPRGDERARIGWQGDRYRYEPLEGDPIGYSRAVGTDWIDDDALFRATCEHPYPDLPHRVRAAMTELVENPAPVLFSMRDGFTYGPTLTQTAAQVLGGQTGTHGSVGLAQSRGFYAGTEPRDDRGALRAEDAFRPWAALVSSAGAVDPG